ncbi:MAG TPA: hypothetical protein VK660_05740, partial [Xanthomonadaceae bacterium]|nr:hypothetical protein [Xanthomonadaceae bacterium]
MLTRTAIAMTLFFVMGSVQAEQSKVTLMNKQEFAAYEVQVNKDLRADKRYSEISPDDLTTIKSKFASMDALWQKA